MKVIDLTHTISEHMPVYPGTEKPQLRPANTYEQNGFRETLLTMFSHTGTHMDAPAHLFSDGTELDSFPIEQFIGTGLVIDCSDLREGRSITMEHLVRVWERADRAEFLLFHTGWDKYWGTSAYFKAYPTITSELADYIIRSGKKGIGVDTIGIDPISDENLTLHKKLFAGRELVVVENLTGLNQLGGELFTLCVLPIKFEHSDGAPVRAAAILRD